MDVPSSSMDPTPFAFKPSELAHMFCPKNADVLARCGGTVGLLKGLGTHPKMGLSKHALKADAPQLSIPPNIISPPRTISSPSPSDTPAFSATLDLRRKVYGANALPTCTAKSLPQLMWMALKYNINIAHRR